MEQIYLIMEKIGLPPLYIIEKSPLGEIESIFSQSNVKCFPSSAIITKQKNSKNTSKDKNYYNAKNKKTLSPQKLAYVRQD